MIKYREELPYLLCKNNLIGIEIGVDYGEFSELLLKTRLFSKFYCIDNWNNTFYDVVDDYNVPLTLTFNSDEIYNSAKNRLDNYKNVIIIRDKSENVYNLFKNEYFDFIYIDSNHTYDNVKLDLNYWWPKVKLGGMLCGDDYFNGKHSMTYDNKKYNVIFGVKSAVDEFCDTNKIHLNLLHFENKYPNWYIFK
jgi:hypothetical protein